MDGDRGPLLVREPLALVLDPCLHRLPGGQVNDHLHDRPHVHHTFDHAGDAVRAGRPRRLQSHPFGPDHDLHVPASVGVALRALGQTGTNQNNGTQATPIGDLGTGVIQCGGGTNPELKDRLLSRLSQACGRQVMYNTLLEQARQPGRWRTHLAHVEDTVRQGIRAIPLCNPGSVVNRFTMKNCQVFRSMPTWLPILQGPDDAKLVAYRDPAIRAKLREEVDAPIGPDSTFSKRWDLMIVEEPQLAKHRDLAGKNMAAIAAAQGKHPMDAFLDLAVEENLDTVFSLGEINMDTEAVAQILGSPYAVVGLSDGGAHVQFHSNVSNPTRLLGYWVREKKIMSLEHAVRRLTFDSAAAFGLYDRGLVQPGMVADLVVFDPDSVGPLKEDVAAH